MTLNYDDDDALIETSERLERQARETRDRAAQEADDAQRQLTEARALVARLEQSVRSAHGVNARALELEQRAANFRGAVRLRAQAAQFDQAAADLTAEAEGLRAQERGYGERIGQVAAQRAQAQAALQEARAAADVAGIAAATATIGACEQAEASLTEQRHPLLERLAAIGDPD